MKFQFYGAAMDANLAVPLIWQNALDRAASQWSADGFRVIVIMDEIDRATPPMAQAAITLCRRALELPGTAVILPYVQTQLWHKVFNPLQNCAPDLLSTMRAVIDGEFPTRHEEVEEIYNLPQRANPDRLLAAKFQAMYARRFVPREPERPRDELRTYRLHRLFSEKYLSRIWDVPEITPGDVCKILKFPSLRAFDGLTACLCDTNTVELALERLIAIEKLGIPDGRKRRRVPTIRSLEGRLSQFLLASKTQPFVPPGSTSENRSLDRYKDHAILAKILFAYLSSALE